MPASGTVDLARLSEAPPTLARIARGLRDRLPEPKLDRLAEIVERIPPDSRAPDNVQDLCWRWFTDTFLPALLDPAGIARHGRSFTEMRSIADAKWSNTKRELATTWLNAWDRGADALWVIGASVIWQELGDQRAGATPGWDAAAHAVRIVAADPAALEGIVGRLQTSVLDLFEGIVGATR